MCTNFQVKQTTLTFLAQICPKIDLWSEIQKTTVRININVVKMPCMPIFRKKDNFDFFGPNLSKKEIRIWNSENWCWNKSQHAWDTMFTNFQTKWTSLTFWAQICPKMCFGSKFQKSKSGFGISIVEILCTPIFRQNGQFFGQNLGKLPSYVQYFGWNIVEGAAESWVEVYGGVCTV